MSPTPQELMTAPETARWFRRSPSWLRQQRALLCLRPPGGQPLYHVRVCRAFILGRLCGLEGEALRRVQLDALAAACEVHIAPSAPPATAADPPDSGDARPATRTETKTGRTPGADERLVPP